MSKDTNASPADKSAAQQTPDTTALEAQNKELQTKLTQQGQQLSQLEGEMELMRPYVKFDGPEQRTQPDYDPNDPDQVFDYKLRTEISKVETKAQAAIKALEFLGDNPDLKPHRDRVAYILANKTDRRKPIDVRLADAGRIVREEIQKIKNEALAEKEAGEKDKAKEAAQAQGVMTGHQTPESDESKETGGETKEEYFASRQQEQNAILGIGPVK